MSLAHLKPVIEAKSGSSTLHCNAIAMRSHFGFNPDTMRRDGFDPSTIELHEHFYHRLESFMQHPVIGEYLATLTPGESYEASGIWVATLQQMRDAAFGEGSPEADLFPHGYISIAGDGGGNSVCFHFPTGRVIFAHHEHTADIIDGEVTVLSDDIGAFLNDLVHDRLKEKLDELD